MNNLEKLQYIIKNNIYYNIDNIEISEYQLSLFKKYKFNKKNYKITYDSLICKNILYLNTILIQAFEDEDELEEISKAFSLIQLKCDSINCMDFNYFHKLSNLLNKYNVKYYRYPYSFIFLQDDYEIVLLLLKSVINNRKIQDNDIKKVKFDNIAKIKLICNDILN